MPRPKLTAVLVSLGAVCTGIAAGQFFDNQRIITWAGLIALFITTYLAQQDTRTLRQEMHNGVFSGIVNGEVKKAVVELAENPDVPAVEIKSDNPEVTHPGKEGRNG